MMMIKVIAQHGPGFKQGMAELRTVGLKEKIGFELEIVLDIDPEEASKIFVEFVVKTMASYEKQDPEILNSIPFSGIEVKEGLIRIILPDPNGKFPEDKTCSYPYSEQTSTPKLLA